MDVWQQVKLHYIGLLVDHHQPELAETFFNSVTTKILHRTLLPERLHLRAAGGQHRVHRERRAGRRADLPRLLPDARDAARHHRAHRRQLPAAAALRRPASATPAACCEAHRARASAQVKLRANFQIQVLSSPVLPQQGRLRGRQDHQRLQRAAVRAADPARQAPASWSSTPALFGEDDLQMLFSFARAYFMVDMEMPSAYVQFLRSLMPRKPRAEIYNALGLAKQGKTLFYRDFLYHLRHSSDKFRIAPGIKGMVMLVFDLPSFPYVFKVIKDYYPPQKDTTREQIKGKYLLVKQHDRVGRMADTLEYSEVAFPRDRFERRADRRDRASSRPASSRSATATATASEEVIIKHLYIERRMIPLNIYLQEAFDAGVTTSPRASAAQIERAVIEYGNAIKDLVAANIFPGDMLWKNFGVTRNGKVVFYDYDEIEYITDCNFRKVPDAAQRGRRDERRGLVLGRPEGRVPRDLRPLPARQRRGARGLHEAPRRPARRRLLAEPQGAHPGRPRARRVSVRREAQALRSHERRMRPSCRPIRLTGLSRLDPLQIYLT